MVLQFPRPGQVPLEKVNQEVGLTVQTAKSLTLLPNFTKGTHSIITYPFTGVLDHINNMRHHALNCLGKFRWKKESRGLTMQVTKSLTLLRDFTDGSHSRMANQCISVLEHINNMRHHTLNHFDKFHW